jgi:hypothetical protein
MFKAVTPPPTVPRVIVAVTGHRPPKLDGYDAANPLRVAIRECMRHRHRRTKQAGCQ